VENSRAASDYGFPSLVGRICERSRRRKLLVVLQEILPVVAQPERERKIWPEPEFVLHEARDFVLPVPHRAIPLLLAKSVGKLRLVILDARKIIRTAKVGVVHHAPKTQVRNIHAEFQ